MVRSLAHVEPVDEVGSISEKDALMMRPYTIPWTRWRGSTLQLISLLLIRIPLGLALTQSYCSNQNTGSDYSASKRRIVHACLVDRS